MANNSIKQAFERMWQHIVFALGNKANTVDLDSHINSKSNPHNITLPQLGVAVTTSEINHVYGVTSNIQTQLNGKAASKHDHNEVYAPVDHSHNDATVSTDGFMSWLDKTKLNNINITYATCSTAADVAEKYVEITNNYNWELKKGAIVLVKFDVSNTASNVKLNVNGTGAYPIWYNTAEYTSTGTGYTGYAGRTIGYMFNGTHWVWIMQSYDNNTTYTNVKLGHGYATCSTAESTAAKVGTLSSYTLTTGGIVAVKFTNAVPANATLNINSKGAKAIYYKGAKITAGVIKAGDTATFIYNGSQYHLLSIDRWGEYTTEDWIFELEDGTTVTKKVVLG